MNGCLPTRCGWCQPWPVGSRFSKKTGWENHDQQASKQHSLHHGLGFGTCFQVYALLKFLPSLLLMMNPGCLWSWNFITSVVTLTTAASIVLNIKKEVLLKRERKGYSHKSDWDMFSECSWNSKVNNFNSNHL